MLKDCGQPLCQYGTLTLSLFKKKSLCLLGYCMWQKMTLKGWEMKGFRCLKMSPCSCIVGNWASTSLQNTEIIPLFLPLSLSSILFLNLCPSLGLTICDHSDSQRLQIILSFFLFSSFLQPSFKNNLGNSFNHAHQSSQYLSTGIISETVIMNLRPSASLLYILLYHL